MDRNKNGNGGGGRNGDENGDGDGSERKLEMGWMRANKGKTRVGT